jgi:hypothetical protein
MEVGSRTRRRPMGRDYAAAKDAEVGKIGQRKRKSECGSGKSECGSGNAEVGMRQTDPSASGGGDESAALDAASGLSEL